MSQLSNNEKISENPSDAPQLCRNCCEFFGSKHNDNLCSKCFKQKCKTEEKVLAGLSNNLKEASPASQETLATDSRTTIEEEKTNTETKLAEPVEEKPKVEKDPSKCSKCSKKVGMFGFKCKCDSTFCKTHRLPEVHDCEFDFKQVGIAKLKKENAAVVAPKLEKI